jgi:demethylspheroidene O-methyltransferase
VALRLVSRRGAGYGLGALGAAMVDNAGVAAMIEHHAALYADLADPVALLRAGRGQALSAYWPYATAAAPDRLEAAQVAPYSALMAASQPLVAAEILDAYKFRRHRALLDVGGGEGAFLEAVAARVPALQLNLFDLPAVAARARTRLGTRATVTGGDMFTDALPSGADVATLVRVLHDHDDSAAMGLLRAVRAALPPGGVLVLAEPMAGTSGAERMGDAYFGMYLLAMGAGRPRSAANLQTMLEEAGFARIRRHRTHTPLICGVLSCVNLA